MKYLIISMLLLSATFGLSQVGIGTDTPNSNTVLDLQSTTKGVLIPRIALTSLTSASPMSAHVAGMSQNGAPAASVTNKTTIVMTNPYQGGCSDTSNSFNYTLSVGAGTGTLMITNNGTSAREYRVIVEKIFE